MSLANMETYDMREPTPRESRSKSFLSKWYSLFPEIKYINICPLSDFSPTRRAGLNLSVTASSI
jgi:hypothetical protein